MVLVLVIGDLHVPHRAVDLPAKFKKLLAPGKINKILCTGNVNSKEAMDYLRGVSADMTAVQGDFDDPSVLVGGNPLPLSASVTVGTVRIGVIHGHSVIPWGDRLALSGVARELDVDVLVSGHTHAFEAFESEGRFYINPGSATGAFSSFRPLVSVPLPVPPAAAAAAPALESDTVAGDVEVGNGDAGKNDDAVANDSKDEKKLDHQESPVDAKDNAINGEEESGSDEEEEDDEDDNDNVHDEDDPINPIGAWGAPAKKKRKKKAKETTSAAEGANTQSPPPAPATVVEKERVRTHKLVSDIVPSFALLDVQGNNVVVYVYKLIDGDVKVEKLDFVKKMV
ncbi:Metallo-dependent phosphatase-like protein [Chytriomyces cf. hyalinus JEL632]|nr:Metallo-dependent phosphatase-like protein [Chytriomyces cf. hyalinus JEL632]